MALEGLKGLTAQDRADWEKKYSTQLEGKSPDDVERIYRNEMFKAKFKDREDYSTLKQMSPEERDAFYNQAYTDSISKMQEQLRSYNETQQLADSLIPTVDPFLVQSDITETSDIEKSKGFQLALQDKEDFMNKSEEYKKAMNFYTEEYKNNAYARDHAVKDIREVAEIISPYYKKYKETDYLPLKDSDWIDIATVYNSTVETSGEEAANVWLADTIQDIASKNQSIFEKAWRGFAGMGASAAGALIGTLGMLKGTADYITGNYDKVEGLNGVENFMNTVIDNNVTRYGNDIVQYGTITNLEEAKREGISKLEVIQTSGQAKGTDSLFDQIFNVNTIPVAIQSGGFTIASMLTGTAEAKVASWAFRGLKGATLAGKTANTTQKLLQARSTLKNIQKAENFTNRFIIPGLVGTTEGVIEGLGTKIEVLDNATQAVSEAQAEYLDKRFQEIMEESPDIDPNLAYTIAWNEYENKYKESLEQAEYVAAKAGINNFMVNSAINGAINQTLKAGLQAPSVQGALQKSRLFKWATPKGKFEVSGTGNNVTVTPKYGFWKQTWNIVKEPAGELSEEYLQSISNATMSGGAEYNIHKFIENKYNGDGSAQVGDYMAGQFAATLSSMGESMIDNESIKSGIYGALSSIIGTPSIRRRDYTSRVKGSDGKYHTRLDFSKKEGESNLEYISRLAPWRSGLVNAVRENKATKKQLYDDAETLTEWLKDSSNKAKFDGIVGTYNWATQMENAAQENDEFGYRNSTLGKTVNDVFMLEKLKGTAYYDSFMKDLVTATNLEKGTPEANSYIKAIRDNIHTNNNEITDNEILSQLKDNANKLLNTIDEIQKHSSDIERTLGNVDEDTKQSLIFGEMSIKNWEKRGAQLNSEIESTARLITENSKASSNMSEGTKLIISRYGSYKKAKENENNLQETAKSLEEDIRNLNNRKGNLTDTEKKILKEKRAKLKSINKTLTSLKDNLAEVKEEDTVLNESEILSLSPVERAIMLNKKHLSNYSEEQRDIIERIIERGTSKDINFYNKVQDAGRMELAKQSFLTQYMSILTDPQSFNMYVQRAKQQASDVLTKKKYESVNNILDYKKFAQEMDKLMDSGTEREQRLIIRALSKANNANYVRYLNNRKTLEDLFNQIVKDDSFKNMDANDADIFTLSLQYLSNNAVDLNDENAVIEALSQTDSNGNSLFEQYVEDINSSNNTDKVVFTSIGEAIQTYKDVMKNYIRDEKEKASNSQPVNATVTTPEQSAPATPVNANPGIFGQAATSLEEAEESARKTFEGGEGKTEPTKENNEESSSTQNSLKENDIVNEFKENSNEDVAEGAKLGFKIIDNSSKSYSESSKERAKETLSNLSKNEFETEEDLSGALVQQANKLDKDSDNEDSTQAANLLRQVASKISIQSQERKRKEKEDKEKAPDGKKSSLVEETRKKVQETNKSIFNNNVNPNSGIIDSSNIQWLKQNYPDSPTVKYWDKYNIESFLRSGKLQTGKEGTKVYFITDDILAQDIKSDMEANNANYTSLDIPIIAVVEDENGPIIIGNKKYQPIGTFPSTNTQNYKGVSNIGRIRNLVGNSKSGELIKDNNGNILTGSLVSIVSPKIPRVPKGKPNNNVQNLIFDTLNNNEKSTLGSIEKKNKHNHPIYTKMKDIFFSKLGFSKEGKYFYIKVPNLKDSVKDFRIFIRYVSNTVDRNSNKLISELFNENRISELLDSNSRIVKASHLLEEISQNFPTNEDIKLTRENGQLVPTGEFKEQLIEIANNLTRKMNNYLVLPSQNWKYTITPAEEILEDGRRLFAINVTDGNNIIPIGRITNGSMSPETKFEFFRNLIMDGTKVRKNEAFDFIKWQVEYPKGENGIESIKGNISSAFDDGILEMSNEGIEYTIKGIEVRSPFTSSGETIKQPEISNPSNATSSKSVNTQTVSANDQVQSNKAIIDSETGSILEGEVVDKPNIKLEKAKEIAEKIANDSQLIQLAPDGSGYINTKTGKKFARVTSIIQADKEAGDRFDPNSPWILPSTNIGTGVDEFVRDFFAGEFHDNGVLIENFVYDYPNAANTQWKHFAQELQKLKNSFDANGLTVIPRDVTVTGTLNVTDSEGNIHTIDVAGTLDLLAYDQEGNFYIFDMKTVRSSIDQHKEEKYARQLSLYKKFLENTYGIQVKSLNIIPIQVKYPEPKGWRKSDNEYSIVEGNQLAINGKEFKDAKPTLFRPKEVGYREPNIQYEKLTDVERAQISEIENMIKENEAPVNQTGTNTNSSIETKEVKVEKVTVLENNEPTIDLDTGLNIGEVVDRRRKKPGAKKVNPKPTRLIPSRLTWGVWEGFRTEDGVSLWNEKTIEALESIGYTEEQWNQLSDEEMEHELNCKGVRVPF